MSRLFGFVINDSQRVACALYPAREALVATGAPEGWGLASYQGGEVLLQRHPKPVTGPFDFYPAAGAQRTDYIVGHVREPGTPAKLENTQPHRFRSWVFAVSGCGASTLDLSAHIPDFLRRNVRGQDVGERMFYVFLASLHDAGKLDDPNIQIAQIAAALRDTVTLVDKIAGKPMPTNMVVTNGRSLLAVRNGQPMFVRQTNGILDCGVCQGPAENPHERRKIKHEHVRSVLIVSEPSKLPEAGFEEIPDASIVGVTRDLGKSLLPLHVA